MGCRTPTLSPAEAELRQKLKAVILLDGVSQSEAETIAESYFSRNVGCGAFTGVRDGGKRWIVDAKFGYGGEPIEALFIDKRSGKLKSTIGPNYRNPLKILP